MLTGKRIGLGVTASHCTYDEVVPMINALKEAGATVVPVVTHSVYTANTRFGTGEEWMKKFEEAAGEKVVHTIVEAEPFGPKTPVDCMVIAPMTGNSLSKFANAATDSPVLMAAKATLRNLSPVVLGISTNDRLKLNGMYLMQCINTKNLYLSPLCQYDPEIKPHSLIVQFSSTVTTVSAALQHRQSLPLLVPQGEK